MNARAKRLIVICGLLLIAVRPLAGASRPLIDEVRIVNAGYGQVDESFVRAQLSQKAGMELSQTLANKDVRALVATERFTDVDVTVEKTAAGIVVIYKVVPRLRLIEPVSIDGAEDQGVSRVREWIGLAPGDYVDEPLVAAKVAAAKAKYHEKLYPDVALSWEISVRDATNGTAAVRVKVQEGAQRGVSRIRFPGNVNVSEYDLRRAINVPQRWNPFYWFSRQEFDSDELEAAQDSLRMIYVDAGYLDAAIGKPVVREYTPGKLELKFPVSEGPLYRIGAIDILGMTMYPKSVLLQSVGFDTHAVASGQAVKNGRQNVKDYYESRGYMNSTAESVLTRRGTNGIVDVTFLVTEGASNEIHSIYIRGNTKTRDKVIRRELTVYPGDSYNGVKIRRSVTRVQNLGFFADDGVDCTYETFSTSSVPYLVNLVFQVEEKATGQFMVGAGLSDIDDFYGYMSLGLNNFDLANWPTFQGGGQKLQLKTEYGNRREYYEFSFTEPWFLDRRLSLGLSLYDSKYDYSKYDVEKIGGSVSLTMGLGGPYRLQFAYRLEESSSLNESDTNTYVDTKGELFKYSDKQEWTLSSLCATLSRDTRNSVYFPTRGSRTELSGTVYGGPFGGDADLYDIEAIHAQYFPLYFKHVLSYRLKGEVIDVYGDTEDVPITERLFAGGARTVRGFKYRDVGPKAKRADGTAHRTEPTGGNSLLLGTVEYSMPLVSKVRLAGFCDAGNVWDDPYEFELDSLAIGAGLGLRFDIALFPLRLDYTWPVQKDDPETETRRFSFSIGYGF